MGMTRYMYVFKAFCTRKERKSRGGQTIHFRFYLGKLNLTCSILRLSALVAGEQIATCFSVKRKKNACVTIRRHGIMDLA